MVSAAWQKRFDLGDRQVWPNSVVLSNGNLAIGWVERDLTLKSAIISAQGDILTPEITIGTVVEGAWQLTYGITELSNGNIILFYRDIVDPNLDHPFKGRFVYSIYSNTGEIVDSADIRTDQFIGDASLRIESNGTATAEFAGFQDANTIRISGIGSGQTLTSVIDYVNHSKDDNWIKEGDLGVSNIVLGKAGIAYEIVTESDFDKTTPDQIIVTSMKDFVNGKPYFGYYELSERVTANSTGEYIASSGDDIINLNVISLGIDVQQVTPGISNGGALRPNIVNGGDGFDVVQMRSYNNSGLDDTGTFYYSYIQNSKIMKDGDYIYISDPSSYSPGRISYSLKNIEKIEYFGPRILIDNGSSDIQSNHLVDGI